MGPEEAFAAGNYSRMALHPEATCRDIVLAGFLAGFTYELGPVLLQLPAPDPQVLLAQSCFHWMRGNRELALECLAAVPRKGTDAQVADTLAEQFSRTVTVLTFSGSPGGALVDSALHRLRADAGHDVRVVTAGLSDADDIDLSDGRSLVEALNISGQTGGNVDLVMNILEDAYLPEDFEDIKIPKIAILADMHHQIMRRNNYYDRHDILISLSSEQHEISSRIFGKTVFCMMNANFIFEDFDTYDSAAEKDIDLSYGGSIIWYPGGAKQRGIWPIVNVDIGKKCIFYQGRFDSKKYKNIVKRSKNTGCFFYFRDYITQPRVFEYLRAHANIVISEGSFYKLILSPLGVDVQSVAGYCGLDPMADADWGSTGNGVQPRAPAPPGEALYRKSGLLPGRNEYADLARRFGVHPADCPRTGREALRSTLGLLLLQAARLAPSRQTSSGPTSGMTARRAAQPAVWSPNFGVRSPTIDRHLIATFSDLKCRLDSPQAYNSALIVAERLSFSLHLNETEVSRGAPNPAVSEDGARSPALTRTELLAERSRLTSEAVSKFPDISVFVIRFYEFRVGVPMQALDDHVMQALRGLVPQHIAAEARNLRNGVPQPLLDLGAIESDRLFGIHMLADGYLRGLAAGHTAAAAAHDLSQALRLRALAFLNLVKGDMHRLAGESEAAMTTYRQSLEWSHQYPNAYIPLLFLLRHWGHAQTVRVVDPTWLLAKAQAMICETPELVRTVGPDLVQWYDRLGEDRMAAEICDLWFRWMYRVVSIDGPMIAPAGVEKIRTNRRHWPRWALARIDGVPGPAIRLVEDVIDYSPLDHALRERSSPAGKPPLA